jgi:hypothetical protein
LRANFEPLTECSIIINKRATGDRPVPIDKQGLSAPLVPAIYAIILHLKDASGVMRCYSNGIQPPGIEESVLSQGDNALGGNLTTQGLQWARSRPRIPLDQRPLGTHNAVTPIFGTADVIEAIMTKALPPLQRVAICVANQKEVRQDFSSGVGGRDCDSVRGVLWCQRGL